MILNKCEVLHSPPRVLRLWELLSMKKVNFTLLLLGVRNRRSFNSLKPDLEQKSGSDQKPIGPCVCIYVPPTPPAFRNRKFQSYEISNLWTRRFGWNRNTRNCYLHERFVVFCEFLKNGSNIFFFFFFNLINFISFQFYYIPAANKNRPFCLNLKLKIILIYHFN